MGADEEATLRTLSAHRKVINRLIDQYHGRFVTSAGDSVLAEFASVVAAMNCAVEIQNDLKVENTNLAADRQMQFRIGVNSGDVIVEGEQIYGDGVNVAARLENLAEPGGICISGTVYEQVRDKLALSYEDRGEQAVKNIARPVDVWRVLLDGSISPSNSFLRRYWRGGVLSLSGLAIALVTFVLVQHMSLKSPHTTASIPPAQPPPVLTVPTIPSIAVMPFKNLSGDPQQEYFSDGITDQLINDLSKLPGLFVISRNSTFAYKGKAATEQELGRALGVRWVLEGSVQRAGEKVRIALALVDANSGVELWTQRFDRSFKDIFAVQDEIVREVVTTLGLFLKAPYLGARWRGDRFLKITPTFNLDAFDDFLRGYEYLWTFTEADNSRGRQWLERAVQLDPNYADAYAALAFTYTSSVLFGWSHNQSADLNHGIELGQKALALDDSNSFALPALCAADWLQVRLDKALAECRRALTIDPNNPIAYKHLSIALFASGQHEEAVRVAEKAMRLDPIREDYYALQVGMPYVVMGRYADAIPLLKRYITAYPNEPWGHATLIVAYAELGREREAHAEALELKRINPNIIGQSAVGKNPVYKLFVDDLSKEGLQ